MFGFELKDTNKKNRIEGAKQIGLATSIPFVLLGGPLVGYFIGTWLDDAFGTAPYLLVVFSVMGLVSSIRETIKLLEKLNKAADEPKNHHDLQP